jgi:hypothetical protein
MLFNVKKNQNKSTLIFYNFIIDFFYYFCGLKNARVAEW